MISAFKPGNIICTESTSGLSSNVRYLNDITERDNHSYLEETYHYILELNKEFNDANKGFYRSLLESGDNEELIHESFGDFFNKIKEIIAKFLAFIKSIFERFVTGLNRFIKSDNYLKKHSKDFNKFSTENEFTFQGYDFTFSSNVPVVNALAAFNSDFVFKLDNNDMSFSTAENIKASREKLSDSLESGDWYDTFRGRVLGYDTPIYKSDFANELFAAYRNGESSKEDIEVDSHYVNIAYSSFTNHDKAISEVKKNKSRIDGEYESIRKQVDKMAKVSYSNGEANAVMTISPDGTRTPGTLTGDQVTQMDLYIKSKVNQVQEMSTIHAMAFAAKLDAYNDMYKQDKAVLYKALSRIQGTMPKEV